MTGPKHGSASRRYQAWFDDNPVERMKAITERLDGVEGKVRGRPCGRNLNCPICQKVKNGAKIAISTHKMKIDLGKLPNTLVVFCENRNHRPGALARAVTKATRLSLAPRPSPSEVRERMRHRVEKMRLTPAYRNLWLKARLVVDVLADAVVEGGMINGDIVQSKKEWMALLKTKSSRAAVKAIAEALDAGLIGRRRTVAPTLEGGRPSFRYGLKCLPTETGGEWPETNSTSAFRGGTKPGPKPSKVGLNPKKPLDIVESEKESYAGVGDYPSRTPPSRARARPRRGDDQRANSPTRKRPRPMAQTAERDGMDDLSPTAWPP